MDERAIGSVAAEANGARVATVKRLTGGISNLTYLVRFEPPAESVVVRVFEDMERARAERSALRVLEKGDVPAPRLLGHGRLADEGWFVVSSRVPGRPAAHPEDPGWIERLATVLAAIHRVGRRSGRLADDPGPARTWIDEGPPYELGELAEVLWPAIERRRSQLGEGSRVLVHGDFHPGNVHWARGRVAGVIDWEMARWGAAAADVAYCFMDLCLAVGKQRAERFRSVYRVAAEEPEGFDAWLLLAALRPLPDPSRWLPSYEGAGYTGLTASVLRRRFSALVRSLA